MSTNVSRPVWQPRNTEETNTSKFISFLNKRHDLGMRSYEDLHQWSIGTEASPNFGEMRTNGLSLPQQDRRGLEECWRLRYGGIWEAIRELLGVVEDERLIRSRD